MSKAANLRQDMPGVAAEVDRARQDHGAAWVNEQIRQGMAGKPDHFYAFEGGHVLGTPWVFDSTMRDDALRCAMAGAQHFVALRRPDEAAAYGDRPGVAVLSAPPIGSPAALTSKGDSTPGEAVVGGRGESPGESPKVGG
jgi:hypothetical protein